MSLQVEKLEKNMAKLTVEVSAEEFDKALTAAYNKNKADSTSLVSGKGKLLRPWLRRCMEQAFYMKMQ